MHEVVSYFIASILKVHQFSISSNNWVENKLNLVFELTFTSAKVKIYVQLKKYIEIRFTSHVYTTISHFYLDFWKDKHYKKRVKNTIHSD